MSIDMEQFRETFVEESLEGLATMESVLLDMQPGSADADAIDDIFRAAHSIKGGSATFGLENVAGFTHVVETLLDEVRNGQRAMSKEAIELFLRAVDCIRDMLTVANEADIDQARMAAVRTGLDEMLSNNTGQPDDTAIDTEILPDREKTSGGWKICFKPFPQMLRSGNDVVRMFRELAELGEIVVKADTTQLLPLMDMDPEEACLSWEVRIEGDIDRACIDEVFEWVEGDCKLDIVAVESQESSEQNTALVATLATENRTGEDSTGEDRRKASDRRKGGGETSSIRVSIDKVDALINMVGELVITQSMLGQLGEDFSIEKIERLQDGLAELERNTRELQESVMRIRMLPISFVFNRFPRMVHDLCGKLDKKAELKLSGEQTELDKTVMEKIGDPLVHLVRNAIDHGIELPEQRIAAGKSEIGTIHLNAYHQGGNILIEIHDDGAGLNRERIFAKAVERGLIERNDELTDEGIYDLLFQPGFSTAEVVSDVSGRGVGMDVVKRNITALGGSIIVTSESGRGATFTIRLPLTLAILDGQLVRVGEQIYIIPLVSIVESLQIEQKRVNAIAGRAELYKLREDYLPIIRLYQVFDRESQSRDLGHGLLVVVEGDGQKVGLLVDDLLGQQQVVIKSLETNFKKVDGLSGATILGDGTVALIVDTAGIVRLSQGNERNVAA
jgi:two-component system chemotaxis sensor kinase CheA